MLNVDQGLSGPRPPDTTIVERPPPPPGLDFPMKCFSSPFDLFASSHASPCTLVSLQSHNGDPNLENVRSGVIAFCDVVLPYNLQGGVSIVRAKMLVLRHCSGLQASLTPEHRRTLPILESRQDSILGILRVPKRANQAIGFSHFPHAKVNPSIIDKAAGFSASSRLIIPRQLTCRRTL